MPDDLSSSLALPPLSIQEDGEVCYWAEQFGVSRERLIRAICMAGPLLHDVRRDLMEAE
ncbi:MAG TPA: DUF3606 domain-containing protein [Pirellulales bacterium]